MKAKRASRAVAAFLARAKSAKAKAFNSVGHGFDVRAEAKHLVGTKLSHQSEALHVSFLALPKRFSRQSTPSDNSLREIHIPRLVESLSWVGVLLDSYGIGSQRLGISCQKAVNNQIQRRVGYVWEL